MYTWLSLCLLTCPENYHEVSLDLLKAVLLQGYLVHIHSSFCVHIHSLYHSMLKSYKPPVVKKSSIPKEVIKQIKKKTTEASKMIGVLEKEAVSVAPRVHKERRIYLRQQLTELLDILADKPGLLGPKITVLIFLQF